MTELLLQAVLTRFVLRPALLVAQALEEDLAMVTADPVFAKYGVNRVW